MVLYDVDDYVDGCCDQYDERVYGVVWVDDFFYIQVNQYVGQYLQK